MAIYLRVINAFTERWRTDCDYTRQSVGYAEAITRSAQFLILARNLARCVSHRSAICVRSEELSMGAYTSCENLVNLPSNTRKAQATSLDRELDSARPIADRDMARARSASPLREFDDRPGILAASRNYILLRENDRHHNDAAASRRYN